MNYIRIPSTKVYFAPIDLEKLSNDFDSDISMENLVEIRAALSSSPIRWGLIFGTLLGAVREGKLIEHDHDTDLYVLAEDRSMLYQRLPVLLARGFMIARNERQILSLVRKGQYTDFYFPRRFLRSRRLLGREIPAFHFESSDAVEVGNETFPSPRDSIGFLSIAYGESWRVPEQGRVFEPRLSRWKALIEKLFPRVARLGSRFLDKILT